MTSRSTRKPTSRQPSRTSPCSGLSSGNKLQTLAQTAAVPRRCATATTQIDAHGPLTRAAKIEHAGGSAGADDCAHRSIFGDFAETEQNLEVEHFDGIALHLRCTAQNRPMSRPTRIVSRSTSKPTSYNRAASIAVAGPKPASTQTPNRLRMRPMPPSAYSARTPVSW